MRQCWPFSGGPTLRFLSGVWFHLKLTERSRAAQSNSPEHLKVHTNTGLYSPLKALDKASCWIKRCTVRKEEKVGCEGISASRGKERRRGLCCAFRQSFQSNALYKSEVSLTVHSFYLLWKLIYFHQTDMSAFPFHWKEWERDWFPLVAFSHRRVTFAELSVLSVFGCLRSAGLTTPLDTRCDLYSRSSAPPHCLDTWQRHWIRRGHTNVNIQTVPSS